MTRFTDNALNRRDVLAAGAGVVAVAGMTAAGVAHASPEDVQAQISKLAGGADVTDGKVTVTVPQIAENGNTVPVSVAVDSPMTEDDYVKSLAIYADGNPAPDVAKFQMSPLTGKAEVSTRMRLAGTQNIVAVAETSKGEFYKGSSEVKVTVGGCGG